jgi:5'-nucleotidase
MTLNSTQIDTLLEQQFNNPSPGCKRILQVSKGFSYSWNESAPTGKKVEISRIMINGIPINPSSLYRVTANSYLADGGDNFSVLKAGVDMTGEPIDVEAFIDYFAAFSPVAPGPMSRIVMVKSTGAIHPYGRKNCRNIFSGNFFSLSPEMQDKAVDYYNPSFFATEPNLLL